MAKTLSFSLIFFAIYTFSSTSHAAIECNANAPSQQEAPAPGPRPESYLNIKYLNNSGDICGSVSNYPCGKQWYWNDEFSNKYMCTNGLTCGYYNKSSYWLTCRNIHNKTMFLEEGSQCGRVGNKQFISQYNNFPSLIAANSEKFIGFGCSCSGGTHGQCRQKSGSQILTCQC